jgi:hypothetical protein
MKIEIRLDAYMFPQIRTFPLSVNSRSEVGNSKWCLASRSPKIDPRISGTPTDSTESNTSRDR